MEETFPSSARLRFGTVPKRGLAERRGIAGGHHTQWRPLRPQNRYGGAIVPIACDGEGAAATFCVQPCDGEGAAATSCGAFLPLLVSERTLIKNQHVGHGTFKRITLTLHTCDMIDEERLDARKLIDTLKNAT